MSTPNHHRLAQDLVLPTLLFMALGGMTWAVRGSSGFGGINGCAFAGVTWGAAWWFIARDRQTEQARPYSSAWIILALTIGIGISGNRGWMQWPSFFDGHLQTNTPKGEFVAISRSYGFLWLFLAGVPWAGLGACMLAWCANKRTTRPLDWAFRLACGFSMAGVAALLFDSFPHLFLPLYENLRSQYADLQANPNLRRLINDNRAALMHLGAYSGFLLYEVLRKDWRNVTLILSVGLVNGVGWAALQNWRWAPSQWPDSSFNWWRCWESSGGLSIGLAYGIGYFLVNRPAPSGHRGTGDQASQPATSDLERWALSAGILLGLGFSVKNGLKGWANLHLGNEEYWDLMLWKIIGTIVLAGLVLTTLWIRRRPTPNGFQGDLFPHDSWLIWTVLCVQNLIAQLVTGPHRSWSESAFSIYYVLLFLVSATIVYHYQFMKSRIALPISSTL
jgi:hypothetical protein